MHHTGLVFADYMQESWWYSIELEGPESGQVRKTGAGENEPRALLIGNIADFLEAYLRDDECLYPLPSQTMA
jgi:hypothetical protein